MQSKGQIQIILGVIVILVIVGVILGSRFLGNGDDEFSKPGEEETIEDASNITEPLRSSLYPTGVLARGTTKTQISVTINEPGYCRYATESGKTYDDMSGRFSYSQDKTFHKIEVRSLKDGQTYQYFVRCRDLPGNRNSDDAIIEFSVGSKASGGGSSVSSPRLSEVPPLLSDLLPTGVLPGGTSETQISVTIDEPGYCRYATESGTIYKDMSGKLSYSQDKLYHTIKIRGLADNRIYEYFVRCRDLKGNENTSDAIIKFGIGGIAHSPSDPVLPGQDAISPYRYDGLPDEDMPYYTKQTLISLKTDEKAVCRYTTISGLSYTQMKIFSDTDALLHSTQVTGFSEGKAYKYYIKCADDYDNINTDDYLISFEVENPEDLTPPSRTGLYPNQDLPFGTTQTQLRVQTDGLADCRYATDQGVLYKSMKKKFTSNIGNIHTATVTGLESGIYYTFFVRCQDKNGNANTGDVMIRFRVTP